MAAHSYINIWNKRPFIVLLQVSMCCCGNCIATFVDTVFPFDIANCKVSAGLFWIFLAALKMSCMLYGEIMTSNPQGLYKTYYYFPIV